MTAKPEKPQNKRRPVTKKTSLPKSDNDKVEQQLRRELDEALRKVARLEAQQKKDVIRREFLEEQLIEYRKLVKPSQSKKIEYQVKLTACVCVTTLECPAHASYLG